MNREQRRAAKHKRGKFDRNKIHKEKCTALAPLMLCTPYAKSKSEEIGVQLRMSWQAIIDGRGDDVDFANLASACNIAMIRCESIGQDALDLCISARDALLVIFERKHRVGKLGVCAQSLRDIPPMIDIHEQLCELSTASEMMNAEIESYRRMKNNEVKTCSKT